ncbi:MAG: sulfoxide reductase heme-binding subunit YedZ [Candidatus Koribacter versatilis]|uniref:Protein-methionine-sulfoxide reductase heme-binding subunit MsrQ n=1 Tax=Candidatus Korobacter versatilis TaxID=658062 RepID=A0A932EQ64_9BACT|nr:sulfoxide reductase heme-binding subunit YedZ [Candidatus Koribacter versatilis]
MAFNLRWRWSKVVVFLLCLLPALELALRAWNQSRGVEPDLGVNPLEHITRATGDWTLRFLLITLAITPLRKLLQRPALIHFRRMAGLFAFFYGSLHFTTYLWFDKAFAWSEILPDVAKRRFIAVGFTAFVLMLPLAITSTGGWIRRLGGKRWQWLHRLVYFSALAGVIHYWWLVKSDIRKPAIYAGILAALLVYRMVVWVLPSQQHHAGARKLATAETVE